jgi:quercetin dioxygenase-like cupin family protein
MQNFCYDCDTKLETLVEGKNYRKIKAHNGSLMLVETIFENGGEGTPHTHVHEQAVYCLEGEFEFTIDGETKIVKTGDTLYMPSNVLHGCKLLSDKGRLLDVFTPQRDDFLNS